MKRIDLGRVTDNYNRVQEQVAEAANSAGRSVSDIRIVGVTKYVDVNVASMLVVAGCTHLGESRPQELWAKAEDVRLETASWHLVGHLQRNKAEKTALLTHLIHSVDSDRLLNKLNQVGEQHGKKVSVLLEVNCSAEQAKHGLTIEEAKALVESAAGLSSVEIMGLMTMAHRTGGPRVARKNFALLRKTRDELQRRAPPNVQLEHLSMGMSSDFGEAIAEGATVIRIGSALFA